MYFVPGAGAVKSRDVYKRQQPGFRDFLDGAALTTSQEHHTVHVAQDGFRVLVIDGLALGQLLVKERQADLTGTNDGHQLLDVYKRQCKS